MLVFVAVANLLPGLMGLGINSNQKSLLDINDLNIVGPGGVQTKGTLGPVGP